MSETEAKEDDEIRIGFTIRRLFTPEPMTGHIRRSEKPAAAGSTIGCFASRTTGAECATLFSNRSDYPAESWEVFWRWDTIKKLQLRFAEIG